MAESTVSVRDSTSGSDHIQLYGVENQRQTLRSEGFSYQVIVTILKSRAAGTRAGYNSEWRVFVCWCRLRRMDHHSTPVKDFVILQDSFLHVVKGRP